MTYGNAPRTQAEWDAKRAEAKAEAAKVVKKNAEEALAAKKAFLTRNEPTGIDTITEPGEVNSNPDSTVDLQVSPANATQSHPAERYPAPLTPAEDQEEEVRPYEEWTNEELSEELKARELPHSGNKAELVARLEEHDKSDEE